MLISATQYAMSLDFREQQGTEHINTKFPLPTLLYAGYVKLINLYYLLELIILKKYNVYL